MAARPHGGSLTAAEMERFEEQGFLPLGPVLSPDDIAALCDRIDRIMLGQGPDHPYPEMMMSVCPSETGAWDHPASRQTAGFKHPTLGYR